jgi:hypothetical protein
MSNGSSGFSQRFAPWLLAITLTIALWLAYSTTPIEEFGGIVRHDAIPACRTNPAQIFDAATPTVSPDLCWAHANDRLIWTFPNNTARLFHVHMSPHPFLANQGKPFEADSSNGVVVSDPIRPHSEYTVYKYAITYDSGKKKLDPHVIVMK